MQINMLPVTLLSVVWISAFSNVEAVLDSARAGWGMIEVSPNPYLSLVYQNFRVSIYKKVSSDPNLLQFYYSPALILEPNSSKTVQNPFTKRDEVTFKVLMWDDAFEKAVQTTLAAKLGKPVPLNSIRILPIEEIQVDSSSASDDQFEVDNRWISYANQPSTHTFRLTCPKENCAEIAQHIKDHPAMFLADLVVHYSLQTQTTKRRSIVIKSQNVRGSGLYDQISQSLPDKDTIFLTSGDLKQLTVEVAQNVLSTEVTEDQFVSNDQILSIARLVENALKPKTVSTATFKSDMWEAFFWNSDNAGVRPDLLTAQLNDQYNKSDRHRQEAIKRLFDSSPSAGVIISELGSSLNLDDDLITLIEAAKQVSEFSGGKFTPKPLTLSRVSLAVLRGTGVIATTQITTSRASSELSTRINTFADPTSLIPIAKDSLLDVIRDELAKHQPAIQTGLIVAFWSTTAPNGWLQCDGTAVNATLYPELHKLTGGFTPDLRGRFLYGTANDSVGLKAGEATHRLTSREMPSHTHEILLYSDAGNYGWRVNAFSSQSDKVQYGTTRTAGGDEAHNNMPPYVTVKFLIKT